MVDRSLYPCKYCNHPQNEHSKHFDRCFMCEENHKYAGCKFKRIDNLEFLEWAVKQKES